jgi:predicted nucleic acid-binding protein
MSGYVDNFLLDTNIVIYLSQGKLRTSDFAKNGGELYISSMTYIEALGFAFPSQDAEKEVAEICEDLDRFFLTREIEKQTINIRKSKKIKLPDAVIAATAIVHNLTLVTANSDDFKNIPELKILNPLNR